MPLVTLLLPTRTWIFAFHIGFESIHQLAPDEVTHREEISYGFPAAMGEPKHCGAVFGGDVSCEGSACPLWMVAVAAPNYSLTSF